jgi:pyridoxine 5-phosphate synthase
MARLGVNIDHVATVRQARRTDEPDPVWAAVEAELGGADGITVHLREDRRHIADRDVFVLRQTVGVKLNLEMSIADDIVDIACDIRPDQSTLVPERREELTTEGGLDVVALRDRITQTVKRLRDEGIVVSAFIEPVPAQVEAAREVGCDAIELWTGAYANAGSQEQWDRALTDLRAALELGHKLELDVHAGHGLTYRNVATIASVHGFSEFNIGHSIVARAMLVGMREAVREMKALLERYKPREIRT